MKLKTHEQEIKQMVDNGLSATKIANELYAKHEIEVNTSSINRLIVKRNWESKITQGRRKLRWTKNEVRRILTTNG